MSKLVEAKPHYSALGKTAKDAQGLIQNIETKVNIKFLVAFGKFYWTPGYNRPRRNDLITMVRCTHFTRSVSLIVHHEK